METILYSVVLLLVLVPLAFVGIVLAAVVIGLAALVLTFVISITSYGCANFLKKHGVIGKNPFPGPFFALSFPFALLSLCIRKR